jgi:hypothetical protein
MTTTSITSIQRGIVFVMAEWSGQAKWAHKQLVDFLAEHRTPPEHLTCIDVDRQPDVYDLPEFSGKIHGYGEAAAVRDGRIVFVTTLGKDKNRIQERCAELLKFYEA